MRRVRRGLLLRNDLRIGRLSEFEKTKWKRKKKMSFSIRGVAKGTY
jgi:hypothetical protein